MKNHALNFNYKSFERSNTSLGKHYHNGYQIIFVTEGIAVFTIDNKVYECPKNTLIFLNNLEEHTMEIKESPYARYDLIFDSLFLDNIIMDALLLSIFKIRNEYFRHAISIREEDLDYVSNIFLEFKKLNKNKGDFWHIRFISLFLEFILYLYENYQEAFPIEDINKKNKIILDVHSYIDNNFTSNFTIDELAAEFYISKYHLIRSFKAITGYTIKQYIILKRITLAKDYLYFTNKNILDISLECGFNDQSNFIKAFKDRENMTPLQFRKYYRDSLDE